MIELRRPAAYVLPTDRNYSRVEQFGSPGPNTVEL